MRFSLTHLKLVALGMAAACSDPSGPDLHGPPFFNATVNGTIWNPDTSLAFCSNADLGFTAYRSGTPSTGDEVIIVSLRNLSRLGTYTLGDSASGRFAIFDVFPPTPGPFRSYWTRSQDPGQINITGLDLQDSLVAGTFHFRAANLANSSDQRSLTGEFRLHLVPIYTAEHPDGSPCLVPPSL